MTSFRTHRRVLRSGIALGAISCALTAAPALSQEGVEEAQVTQSGALEQIVVTANRREENLQDVAISAATLQPDRLQSLFAAGADNTALAAQVPGLFVESSNGRAAPRFYIRGLGNTDFDLAASQPVSVVYDDVVLENVTLKAFPIFDVDRIEVLRGPQGTLFGRNTPAGIVKIDTKRPGDTVEAQGSLSVGSFASISAEAAVGGPLVPEVLSARLSVLYQHRDNWVDNGFSGEENALGGYDDFAIRGQLLLTPTERLSILGSLQYRKLDGTSTLFRANILGPGDNELNENYDRDTVVFDAGAGNQSIYDVLGLSGTVAYEFDGATLTSITSFYQSEGSSRGDIDGGNLVTGPGFIPFPSDTRDTIDLDQTTQEVRLASNGDGPISWQIGGYYFDSSFTVLTEGFDFPPPVLVQHDNESWAVFGQVGAEITEALKLTVGVRYTEDDKDFVVLSGAAPQPTAVSDERVTWDASLLYNLTDDVSVYARAAEGFRAPTIQGRDVAFFNPPSVAQSEVIRSYEIGFKTELADRRIRLNGAVFTYTVDDPQFTAVGGGGNLVQLVNADEGKAWGFELDTAFQITPQFLVTLGASYNDTEIDDPNLAVGICAQCTVTDPIVNINGSDRALVDGNAFPNAPEWTGDLTARYGLPVGNDGEFFVFTDWTYQGRTNFFLYESLEFFSDNQIEGGLQIGYSGGNGAWEVSVFARNITNEDNVKGGIDFNNLTAFVNDPRVIGGSVRFSY